VTTILNNESPDRPSMADFGEDIGPVDDRPRECHGAAAVMSSPRQRPDQIERPCSESSSCRRRGADLAMRRRPCHAVPTLPCGADLAISAAARDGERARPDPACTGQVLALDSWFGYGSPERKEVMCSDRQYV